MSAFGGIADIDRHQSDVLLTQSGNQPVGFVVMHNGYFYPGRVYCPGCGNSLSHGDFLGNTEANEQRLSSNSVPAKQDVKFRLVNPGLRPRRTKLEMPGWAGQPEPRNNGAQEYAWHLAREPNTASRSSIHTKTSSMSRRKTAS
jgi:hypothetical protein